jgi:hypothetical protein
MATQVDEEFSRGEVLLIGWMLSSKVPSDNGELITGTMVLDAREPGRCAAQGEKLARGVVSHVCSDGESSDEHGSEAINDPVQFLRVRLFGGAISVLSHCGPSCAGMSGSARAH